MATGNYFLIYSLHVFVKVATRGKTNINIWLPVVISILIGQLQKNFKSKRPVFLAVLLIKPTEML
jgi:hypothetical protein